MRVREKLRRPLLNWAKNWQLLVLVAIAFLLSFTIIKLLGLLLLLYITARLLKKWFGFITALVVGYLSFCVFVAIVSLLLWQVNGSLSIPLLFGLWSLLLAAVIGQSKTILEIRPRWGEVLRIADLMSLLAAVLVCFMLFLPVFGSFNTNTMVRSFSIGGDNSVHLDLVKSIDLNKNVVYGQSNRFDSSSDASIYPQGWHVNVAVLVWLLQPLLKHYSQTSLLIDVFYLSTILWFGLFIYMLCTATLYVLERPKNYLSPLVAIIPLSIAVLGWLVTMFNYGHQPNIAAITFFLLEILAGSIACKQIVKGAKKTHPLIYISLLAATGSVVCYYYLAPAAVISFATIYFLYKYYSKRWPSTPEIVAIVLTLLFWVYQISFRFRFVSLVKGSNQSLFTVTGLVAESDFRILFVVFLVAAIGYLFFRKNRYLTVAMAIASGTLLLSGILRIGYFINHDPPAYYLYKLNLSFIASIAIVYGMIILLMAESFTKQWGRNITIVGMVLLIGLGAELSVLVRSPLVGGYFQGTNFGMDWRQTSALLRIISPNPSIGDQLVFIGSCNRAQDIRATEIARSLTPHTTDHYIAFSATALGALDKNEVFGQLKNYYDTYHQPVIIVGNDLLTDVQLRAYLGSDQKGFKFVELDPDLFQETALQCPNRIRTL